MEHHSEAEEQTHPNLEQTNKSSESIT